MTGILQVSSVLAVELNPTVYVLKGQPAPFTGYLVEPERMNKTLRAYTDLDIAQRELILKTTYYEERLAKEKALNDDILKAKLKESEAVEKELKAKVADLDVWYKKPWFVGSAVAIIFIAIWALVP